MFYITSPFRKSASRWRKHFNSSVRSARSRSPLGFSTNASPRPNSSAPPYSLSVHSWPCAPNQSPLPRPQKISSARTKSTFTVPSGSAMNLKSYLKSRQATIDRALDRYLPKENVKPATIHKAMRYSLFAGGKRLRPILCLAAAEACGSKIDNALPLACAMECIHTYSLVHDDLPSMDNDDFRRGRATCHKVFGDGIAVLAGDALLTLAFEIVSRAKPTSRYDMTKFGRALGLAFQVIDDILDVTQTSEKLGKSAGKDVAAQKATYPAIIGLDKSRVEAKRLTKQAHATLSTLGEKGDALHALANYLLEREY